MFLYAVEATIVGLLVWIAVFQVLIPMLRGAPLFPVLRQEHFARKILAEAEESARAAEILKTAESVHRSAVNPKEETENAADEPGK